MEELYKKYRPATFDDVVGNEASIKSLKKLIENGTHVFMFTGPAGCGKTTLARIVAKEVGADSLDITEINSSDNRGIDTAREISEIMKLAPMGGKSSVWIFDECHQWSKDAQNAYLKMLEDTPSHVYFILCTTNPEKLISPLKTRCSQIAVKPLTDDEMVCLINRVVRGENVRLSSRVIETIVDSAEGGSREALQLLNKVIHLDDEETMLEVLKSGAVSENKEVIDFCRILMNKSCVWGDIAGALKKLDLSDPEKVRLCVMGYMNSVLMKNKNRNAELALQAFGNNTTFGNGKFQITIACLDFYNLIHNS